MWFQEYLVEPWLPVGTSGDWRIERVRFDGNWDQWFERHDLSSGLTPPGLYTALLRGEDCWMTDQPRELLDSQWFCDHVRGRILITGLGMGAVPAWLAKQDRIQQIDIVERDQDVIQLVWPHLSQLSDKLRLHHADALEWQPTEHWNYAWHDIWPKYPTEDQVQAICSRYSPFVDEQICWQAPEMTAGNS